MLDNKKITLSSQVTYELRVPGEIKQKWFNQNITGLHIINNPEPESVFRINVDQAGLIGFLRILYNRGIPILEVTIPEMTDGYISPEKIHHEK